MITNSRSKPSAIKEKTIADFSDQVSSAKAAFFQKYGADWPWRPETPETGVALALWRPGFVQVPFDDVRTIKKAADTATAAVILETVPATLGVCIPAEDHLPSVRKICDRQGIFVK